MSRSSQNSVTKKRQLNVSSGALSSSAQEPLFLAKLDQLREFVGSCRSRRNAQETTYTVEIPTANGNSTVIAYIDGDLSNCLRSSHYNVELAAERLLTGRYSGGTRKQRRKQQNPSLQGANNVRAHDAARMESMASSGTENLSEEMDAEVLWCSTSQEANQGEKAVTRAPSTKTSRRVTPSKESLDGEEDGRQRPTLKSVHEDDDIAVESRTPKKSNASFHSSQSNPVAGGGNSEGMQFAITVIEDSTDEENSNITVAKSFSVDKEASSVDIVTNPPAATLNVRQVERWLLCRRWVVAFSTSRNGSIRHGETLQLSVAKSGPPIVRFRGTSEGTLSQELSSILAPLLRLEDTSPVCIHATTMMEDRRLIIGSEIPLSLSVYISDPLHFFSTIFLDEAEGRDASNSNDFFARKKSSNLPFSKKAKFNLPLGHAAFCLLQWAQYGDNCFSAISGSDATHSHDGANEQQDEGDESTRPSSPPLVEGTEADFEPPAGEEESSGLSTSLLSGDEAETEKPGAMPESEDPAGLTEKGVELRSYQRQALYWMMKREADPEDRSDLSKEMELLAELSKANASEQTSSPSISLSGSPPVACDCGPVQVSMEVSKTAPAVLNGTIDPLEHPLWQRRFLATEDCTAAACFYVNEVLRKASAKPPDPPRQCRGGILADAMGLGKTVMLLSLISKSKEEYAGHEGHHASEGNTTLVVTPLSLLSQWHEEVLSKTTLSARVYYGDTRDVDRDDFDQVDVVLTTYGTVQGEFLSRGRRDKLRSAAGTTASAELLVHPWQRVILDEAHCIKNPQTAVARACCLLNAERRWAVTGTPLQNSLEDVYGLVKFLKHEPWCEASFWKTAITKAVKQGGNDDLEQSSPKKDLSGGPLQSGMKLALGRVRRLLTPLILRRTKDTLDAHGKPILTLPPVESSTVSVTFSHAEREFYNALLSKSQSVFDGFIRKGVAAKSWLAIFSLLQRLRQACDHVALTVKTRLENPEEDGGKGRDFKVDGGSDDDDGDDGGAVNDKFLSDLLALFRRSNSRQNTKGEESDYSAGEESQERTSMAYASDVAMALSQSVQSNAACVDNECPVCLERTEIENAVITPCAHVFCRECLVSVLRESGTRKKKNVANEACASGPCPVCNLWVDSKKIIALSRSGETGEASSRYLLSKSPTRRKKEEGQSSISVRGGNDRARQTLEEALEGSSSAKLRAVLSELDNIWKLDPGSKIVVFSQFLGFLDLLRGSLETAGIQHFRLDGKMNLKERTKVLNTFNKASLSSDPGEAIVCRGSVFLVSMKAGGVGINLVAASSVFLVDPWWNFSVEDQCVNRIHRIGQKAKIVRVRRFVVEDSVEEKIVRLQRRKKEVAAEILSDETESATASDSKPTLEDFKILLGR